MRAAVTKARMEAKEGIAYLPAYVDRVLVSMQQPGSTGVEESFNERAARNRMGELAPLAAAQAPVAGAGAALVADGYSYFANQPALPVVVHREQA